MGPVDTWGDLYIDDNGTIKAIAGIGSSNVGTYVVILNNDTEFIGNFQMKIILEPGQYYLRVSHENDDSEPGTYEVRVAPEKID